MTTRRARTAERKAPSALERQQPAGPTASGAPRRGGKGWLAGCALLAIALLGHGGSLAGGWIVDDFHYVVDNPLLDDASGLRRIWTEPTTLLVYYPLTFTTFWIEKQICGLDPGCFHGTNVALHALTSLLAWFVLRRLAIPGAWLAAALFAVHPLHVDSVAWVAERKNVLSGALAVAALLSWLEFDERRARRARGAWIAWTLGFALFLLALLSKTAVLGLPAVAVLVVAWRRGGFERRDLAALPWLILGAALSAVTVAVERLVVGGGDPIPSPALLERPLLAARAALFYLGKLLWPRDLAFDYGHWETHWSEPANLLAAAALAGLLGSLWAWRRRIGFGPLVALVSFLVLAAPALGLVRFYFHRYSFVAGHFVYLASLSILALVAATAMRLLVGRVPRGALVGAAALLLAGLAFRTRQHTIDYRDAGSLARGTLAVNPGSWLAHNQLGDEALRRRDFAAALEHLAQAERAAPGRIETQFNLAIARMNSGDLAGAERDARRALSIRDAAHAHLLLGDVLLRAGRFEEAAGSYRAAAERDPGSRRASAGLGIALARAGRDHDEAIRVLEGVLRADPANLPARTALAYSLAALGRREEAVAELERALAQDPGNPVLLRNRELLGRGAER